MPTYRSLSGPTFPKLDQGESKQQQFVQTIRPSVLRASMFARRTEWRASVAVVSEPAAGCLRHSVASPSTVGLVLVDDVGFGCFGVVSALSTTGRIGKPARR
jgi:hypothetical protein